MTIPSIKIIIEVDLMYTQPTTVIMRCFVVRIWFILDSNKVLHHYLSIDSPYSKKVEIEMSRLSLLPLSLPSRHTFDRWLKTISTNIKERITIMGNLFVSEAIAKPYIVAIDSTHSS